jgi:hypothetical protein
MRWPVATSWNRALGQVPSAAAAGTAGNADLLDGLDSSQLEGARAYALSGGTYCPGNPVVFCSIPRNKGVGYIRKVAEGRYCVGVDGISAADPKSVAVVSVANSASSDTSTTWLTSNVNCVAREFEALVGFGTSLNSGFQFTIVIPWAAPGRPYLDHAAPRGRADAGKRGRGASSGVAAELEFVALFTLRDGEIVRNELYLDREKALEAAARRE